MGSPDSKRLGSRMGQVVRTWMPIQCCGRYPGQPGTWEGPGYIGDSHLGESRLPVGWGDQRQGARGCYCGNHQNGKGGIAMGKGCVDSKWLCS